MGFTQSLQDSLFIASIFIAALFIICTVSLALRNYEAKQQIKKLKKWRKFSEIEKAQKHEEYDRIATELAEVRAFNDTQGDMHVRLMLKYAGIQEESDKLQNELKIAHTCLKVAETEITELKAKLERKRNEKGQFVKTTTARDWTTATKDELLAEAKRRGFVKGAIHTGMANGRFEITDDLYFYGMCMYGGGSGCIYDGSRWAEILSNA